MELKNLRHTVGDENKQETGTVRRFYHSTPFVLLFLFWGILARLIHNSLILPPFSAVAVSAFSPPLASLYKHARILLLRLLIMGFTGLFVDSVLNVCGESGQRDI